MLKPSIDSLMSKINSKYTLVTISARRARELREQPELFSEPENARSVNYVGMALEEIESEYLSYDISEDKDKEYAER
ncbi:DNA-directed RNA polymerase subunit omega [Paenalkalicoccus suaedae]|uniref:DNA-directed RNA polymerase subunit omega n=1 Tax=Paenalkalicoccus suaedae TaxID=2592382 RepID=A0A859FF91_9BACI|nr:DNA-directed RNA polymerase subunit omega [Paenalkalicoccus suaedae]QKS71488.1 DNA-directed RNA polymerase subunit omega [Paenalkalicoccus suaedae]